MCISRWEQLSRFAPAVLLALSVGGASPGARSETPLEHASRELKALQASDAPASEERATIERAWTDTIQAIQEEQRWQERKAEFLALTADVPRLLAETRAALAAPNGPQASPAAADSLPALETRLAQAQARRSSAEQLIQELQQERRRRTDRSLALPGELSNLRQQIESLSADQEGLAPTGVSAALAEALRALAAARGPLLAAELAAREAELSSYEARSALLTARQDLAVRRAYESTRVAESLSEQVGRLRNAAADAAAVEAEALRRRLEAAPEIVRELALENEALASERRDHVANTQALSTSTAELTAQADQVLARQADVTRRVEAAAFTKPVALLMRKHRGELPQLGRNRAQLRARQRETTELVIRQLDVEGARAELTDLDAAEARASRRLEDLDLSPEARAEAEAGLRDLLSRQRDLLDELNSDIGKELSQIAELDAQQRRLIDAAESYGDFIDEHLLWLRESSVFGPHQLRDLGSAAAWLAHPERWSEFLLALSRHLAERLVDIALCLVALLLPLMLRRRLLHRLEAIGGELGRSRRHRFASTVQALACTAFAAAAWPAALAWCGLTVGTATADTAFGPFVAVGLAHLAWLLLPFLLLIDTCRPQGLAHAHFRWPAAQLEAVRKSSWLLGALAVPALTVAWAFEGADRADLRDSLGRLALLVGLATFAVFHQRALDPSLRPGRARRRDRLAHRFAVVLPLLLVLAGLLGYSFAARELGLRLIETHALFFIVAMLHATALRWLVVERRRLRLEALRKSSADETPALDEVVEQTAQGEAAELDLELVDAQTRQLLRAAAIVTLCVSSWWLWAEFLPATRAAENVVLWTANGGAAEAPATSLLPAPSETESVAPAPTGHRVTLLDMLVAIALVSLTLIAASNVPGLLEIAVLRRLDLQPGTGYAITTLTRYALMIGGLAASAGLVGISWGSIQWLAAAMTVGLGFGLQEIFANFVSGLIILFERPVRVGDIVTVGGIEGVVTRIRTRATTISDWDRRELLVPNREFITGQLINWTLTDPVTRIVIPVGIAYGSDTRKAAELLLACAKENQLVLREPAPSVVFRAFGESSLDFQLRVFLPRRDVWPQVVHQLHVAIDDAFRAASIEIAFPQRDIHVRTLPETPARPA